MPERIARGYLAYIIIHDLKFTNLFSPIKVSKPSSLNFRPSTKIPTSFMLEAFFNFLFKKISWYLIQPALFISLSQGRKTIENICEDESFQNQGT